MAIVKQISYLREGFEGLLAAPKSQATFSALSIDRRRRFRDRLEIQLESTSASTSFVHGLNISDTTLAAIKLSETGLALYRGHHQHLGINDLTSAVCNLNEYIWEVSLCIVMTGEVRLGPNIWPKAVD